MDHHEISMEKGAQAGDWICDKILGKGSYGVVGLWKHRTTQELIAVKKFEMKNSSQSSESTIANLEDRYRQEVIMMYEQIDNPHVVATKPTPEVLTFKFAEVKSTYCESPRDSKYEPVVVAPLTSLPLLTMEFCDGGDLRQMLKRAENLSGLGERDVRTVLAHISDAITYLHGKNIIHRDIKPENILVKLSTTAKEAIYKLSDLGFAKDVSAQDSCKTVLGTLPYLAPEIYFQKKYDYTVDYWSFGLISFEITCGKRPFLPGESPAQWIPEVEKKSKDVIAMYRTEGQKIVYSRDIPYNTHLSKLFKKCLVAWLASMLQFDPSRRGKYVLTNDNTQTPPKDANALVRLRNMLATKFLEVCTFSERLVFAIGRSVKIESVMKWVEKETGTLTEDQMLLTADGRLARPDELAIFYYLNYNGLYLIPKQWLDISTKVVTSKILNNFLQGGVSIKKVAANNIWIAATYFMRQNWEQIQLLHTAAKAFRLFYNRKCIEELKGIVLEIDKRAASLNTLIELEQKLEEIESGVYSGLDDVTKTPDSFRTEGENLKSALTENYEKRDELAASPPSKLDLLGELYKRMLRLYERYKQEGVDKEDEIMLSLKTLIAEFMVLRETSVNIAADSMKKVLERLPQDNDLKEKLQVILAKFNVLIDQVITLRVTKQKMLVNHKDPQTKSTSSVDELEGSTEDESSRVKPFFDDETDQLTESLIQMRSHSKVSEVSTNRNSFSPDLSQLLKDTEWIQKEMDLISMSASLMQESFYERSGSLTE